VSEEVHVYFVLLMYFKHTKKSSARLP